MQRGGGATKAATRAVPTRGAVTRHIVKVDSVGREGAYVMAPAFRGKARRGVKIGPRPRPALCRSVGRCPLPPKKLRRPRRRGGAAVRGPSVCSDGRVYVDPPRVAVVAGAGCRGDAASWPHACGMPRRRLRHSPLAVRVPPGYPSPHLIDEVAPEPLRLDTRALHLFSHAEAESASLLRDLRA